MKFKDIEKFPHSNYSSDVDWLTMDTQIASFGQGGGVNLNPVYQRGYVWSDAQRTAYIEYILKGGRTGKDIYFNAVNWQGSGPMGVLELVDGKQRIEAVRSFLSNKTPIFNGHYYKDFTDRIRLGQASFKFHINNLSSPLEVVDWYLGLNTGGSVHTPKDLEVAHAYRKEIKSRLVLDQICKLCNAPAFKSKGYGDAVDKGSKGLNTVLQGQGKLIDCLKCSNCGHSWT